MRKSELVSIHALLFEVRTHLERRDAVDDGAFESYDALGVRPSHVHRPKEVHREAVERLGAALKAQAAAKARDAYESVRPDAVGA